jgi:xanthine dehydrogenase accessory factor
LVSLYETLRDALLAEEPVVLATIVEVAGEGNDGGEAPDLALGAKLLVRPDLPPLGSLGDEALDRVVSRDALGALTAGHTSTRHYGRHGEARQREVAVFMEAFAPPPSMVIFGAVDFTAALARVAKLLGYRVTVCDARAVFATPARFPMADEVVVDWPDRHLAKVGQNLGPRDAICVLTHDPKFDVPALMAALATGAGYVGAMGSRRTNDERVQRLREAGATEEDLGRVMSPIGLDIGARTPEETAISVAAEIIGLRTGRGAPSLRDTEGPIHPRSPREADPNDRERTARVEPRAATD